MKIYGDRSLCNLPRSKGKIELFTLGKSATSKEVKDEYVKRGLVPVHVDDFAKYCKSIADDKPVATQWINHGFCYAAFDRWDDDGRSVSVGRDDNDWGGGWSFAGVPQETSKLDTSIAISGALPLELKLIDYFAAKALEGLLAKGYYHNFDGSDDAAMHAKQAYWYARAMIKERNNQENG